MLTEEFPDEKVLVYLKAHERQQSRQAEKADQQDISKGYALINGEKTIFTWLGLSNSTATVLRPEKFSLKVDGIADGQTTELSNHNQDIRLLFKLLLKPQDGVQERILEQMKNSAPSPVQMISQETEQAHVKYVEFAESIGHEVSNYRLEFSKYFPADAVLVQGSFICAEYRVNDWQEIFYQIMDSVKA